AVDMLGDGGPPGPAGIVALAVPCAVLREERGRILAAHGIEPVIEADRVLGAFPLDLAAFPVVHHRFSLRLSLRSRRVGWRALTPRSPPCRRALSARPRNCPCSPRPAG